jgi:hypothetical protein
MDGQEIQLMNCQQRRVSEARIKGSRDDLTGYHHLASPNYPLLGCDAMILS